MNGLAWFFLIVALLMLVWNAFLMHINHLQQADVRRLSGYAVSEYHRRRREQAVSILRGGEGR